MVRARIYKPPTVAERPQKREREKGVLVTKLQGELGVDFTTLLYAYKLMTADITSQMKMSALIKPAQAEELRTYINDINEAAPEGWEPMVFFCKKMHITETRFLEIAGAEDLLTDIKIFRTERKKGDGRSSATTKEVYISESLAKKIESAPHTIEEGWIPSSTFLSMFMERVANGGSKDNWETRLQKLISSSLKEQEFINIIEKNSFKERSKMFPGHDDDLFAIPDEKVDELLTYLVQKYEGGKHIKMLDQPPSGWLDKESIMKIKSTEEIDYPGPNPPLIIDRPLKAKEVLDALDVVKWAYGGGKNNKDKWVKVGNRGRGREYFSPKIVMEMFIEALGARNNPPSGYIKKRSRVLPKKIHSKEEGNSDVNSKNQEVYIGDEDISIAYDIEEDIIELQ